MKKKKNKRRLYVWIGEKEQHHPVLRRCCAMVKMQFRRQIRAQFSFAFAALQQGSLCSLQQQQHQMQGNVKHTYALSQNGPVTDWERERQGRTKSVTDDEERKRKEEKNKIKLHTKCTERHILVRSSSCLVTEKHTIANFECCEINWRLRRGKTNVEKDEEAGTGAFFSILY